MKQDDVDKDLAKKVFNDLLNELGYKKDQSNKLTYKISNDLKEGILNPNNKIKDEDMLISMTRRLNQVEKQNSLLMEELSKSKSIIKEQNKLLEKQKECSNCKILNNYISDLECYTDQLVEVIKQEGNIILVNRPEKHISIDHHDNYEEIEEAEEDTINLPKEIDYDTIVRRIDDLNHVIRKESNFKLDPKDGIHKLTKHEEKNIYFYKNGILIDDYPFYDYKEIKAMKILQDILDGYIPFVFHSKYPNGIPLNPIKKTHINFEKKKDNIPLAQINQPITEKKKLTSQEFLDKLPQTVIKNGKIINIGEELEKFLVVKKNNEEFHLDKEEYFLNKCNPEDYAKLKIKIDLIGKTLILNADKSGYLKEVFDYVKFYINKSRKDLVKNINSYILKSTFPLKIYRYDEIKSLYELGLYPTQFLIFEALK